MSEYLAKAAELIDRAAASNETNNKKWEDSLHNGRLQIATAYAMLAAIEKGLLPEPIAEEVYGQFKTLTDR